MTILKALKKPLVILGSIALLTSTTFAMPATGSPFAVKDNHTLTIVNVGDYSNAVDFSVSAQGSSFKADNIVFKLNEPHTFNTANNTALNELFGSTAVTLVLHNSESGITVPCSFPFDFKGNMKVEISFGVYPEHNSYGDSCDYVLEAPSIG